MLNKIAHCYDIEKNFKYSTFNWYLTTRMSTTTNRQNKSELFSPYFSEITNYSSSSFWGIKSCFYHRNSSAFLLHNSKIFSNVKLFSIFSQTFLELISAGWNNSPAVKKILRILCVWTLKMLYTNKRILT